MNKKLCIVTVASLIVGLLTIGAAYADPSPNGHGQPGAPGTTCGSSNAATTPGSSISALGSPFYTDGIAGLHYAGNPGTPSLNSNNPKVVSQYDIACFQVCQNHP